MYIYKVSVTALSVALIFMLAITEGAAPSGEKKKTSPVSVRETQPPPSREIKLLPSEEEEPLVFKEEEKPEAPIPAPPRVLPQISLVDKLYGNIEPALGISGLEQFGYEIFKLQTRPVEAVIKGAVAPEYILGPGDTVLINIWGKITERHEIEIDKGGKAVLPNIGVVFLWGKTFGEAKEIIKSELDKKYTNIETDISISKLRNINVHVIGDVNRPGSYTLTSLSTILGALYRAGGPTPTGSLRNIQIIRAQKIKTVFDLYDFLLKGDLSNNEYLQSNDTVFVPPVGNIAAISGNVKKTGIYELRGETSLLDLAEMAGGFTTTAYLQHIQLIRIEEFTKKVVVDLEFKGIDDIKKSEKNIQIKNGDLVLISSILPERYNFVKITGNVKRPGEHEFVKGMKVSDLIKVAEGILPETYLEKAEIQRYRSDYTREPIHFNLKLALEGDESNDLLLEDWDIVQVSSIYNIFPEPFVRISGEVHKPDGYRYTEGMRISDLIFLGGELKDTASLVNAELFRWNYENGGPPEVIPIDLTPIVKGGDKALPSDDSKVYPVDNAKDILLQRGDHLFIRDNIEFVSKTGVIMTGEVRYSGTYMLMRGERLSSIIKRAGGLTSQAFPEGAVFIRESIRNIQQSMLEKLINARERAFLEEELYITGSILQIEEKERRQKAIEYKRKALNLMASFVPKGRVIIDLKAITNGKDDILLEGRDSLHVPSEPAGVLVSGAVYNPESVAFKEHMPMEYYLNAVGGPNKSADKDDIYVVKANGRVESKSTGYGRISRGDIIVVPEKIK